MNSKIQIFDYSMDFRMFSNLLLITGDSGQGKMTVYNYFKHISFKNDKYVCLDSSILKSDRDSSDELILQQIINRTGKCFVIDNADTLLGDKSRDYIGLDITNEYIIFGNNVTGLFINPNRTAELKRDDVRKEYILDYKYKK